MLWGVGKVPVQAVMQTATDQKNAAHITGTAYPLYLRDENDKE